MQGVLACPLTCCPAKMSFMYNRVNCATNIIHDYAVFYVLQVLTKSTGVAHLASDAWLPKRFQLHGRFAVLSFSSRCYTKQANHLHICIA